LMLAPNTILQNRYRVVRELGHGGMGTVYEAVDQRVNCIVALKETFAGKDEEGTRAFEREASLLGNLRHSALPKVMDYFTEGDGDFLVMEFIPGYDLAELLESREGPFPQSQVLRWADELLKVLEYLHQQEPPILHRDIKPSNLKLTKQGEIFLLDFGLAKGSLGQMATLATSRSVRGYTPLYASLEQIHGHGTDARSDIYSLGATLYHLLTGAAPIDAPTRFHFIEDEQPDPLPAIVSLNSQGSSSVAEVIHRAMAVSRKQRLVSAAEMRKALRNAAEEDERHSAEEEYARAEQRRREREEERQRIEQDARQPAQEENQHAAAETLKKEASRAGEDERRQEEARNRAEEERLRAEREAAQEERAEQVRRKREEEERRRAQIPLVVPGPTISAGKPSFQAGASASSLKTIPAPAPEKFTTDQLSARATLHSESGNESAGGRNRTMIVVIALAAIVLGGVLVVWLLSRTASTTNSNMSNSTRATRRVGNEPPAGMVYVSGGTFVMGRDNGMDEAERPGHQVKVEPFFIDIDEVTNEGYQKFVQATGHGAPMTWPRGIYPAEVARKPVTGVTWDDASSYAQWAGKRLPTEEQWEFAARGTDGRIYPWGNNFPNVLSADNEKKLRELRKSREQLLANYTVESPQIKDLDRQIAAIEKVPQSATPLANAGGVSGGLVEVGKYKGASPFGVLDLAGNAWEWTASDFRAYPGGRLPATVPSGDLKVIRGGSYESTKDFATSTYRTGWPATGAKTYDQTGFRCVKDATK
jgi:serine/threonine protein kinase/formylglycine-generating enzyme required for sulfatase activity